MLISWRNPIGKAPRGPETLHRLRLEGASELFADVLLGNRYRRLSRFIRAGRGTVAKLLGEHVDVDIA